MTKVTKVKVELECPFNRGESTIKTIDVRRPSAGELRGVHLIDLLQMDTASLFKVLPRITTPSLTEKEINDLDPSDLISLGVEVLSFLASKRLQEAEATLTA